MKTWLASVVAVAVLLAPAMRAEDSLSSARDLYAAAEYEDALLVLNKLRGVSQRTEDGASVEQYRAFCLLALGRAEDAVQAIEAVVTAEPSYQPSDADVSPRVRSAFKDVRRRMLPTIIEQRYASAKAAFDRKDFAAAEDGFKEVLAVLTDPDVGSAASQPPLSDIRMLATGFHELSATAAAPPPPIAASPTPVQPPPVAIEPVRPKIYTMDDAGVVPPVTVRQSLPPFQFNSVRELPQGNLEIVIDERGLVESASIRRSIYPTYDTMVLDAAKNWLYKPATLDGAPVKYRKLVGITVKR
jgi:tetratricopeptide (TPR) repeat protein